jgi:asparagine synthase (glutamine-hydrolysing)
MANSLEARPPLLDNELIDFAFHLPSEWKIRNGKSKYLLKRLARDILPAEILRLPKRGFGVPMARWIRGPLIIKIEAILAGDSPVWMSGFLSKPHFENFFQEHMNFRKDHSKTFWALLVLDHWMKRYGVT